MMSFARRVACVVCAMLAAACASPSTNERAATSEVAQMASLKREYPGVVMGFDVRDPSTVIVSLDLQSFDEMDDDAAVAMKRSVLARWRTAWMAAHPHAHATLNVRFIDFIGRKIAVESNDL